MRTPRPSGGRVRSKRIRNITWAGRQRHAFKDDISLSVSCIVLCDHSTSSCMAMIYLSDREMSLPITDTEFCNHWTVASRRRWLGSRVSTFFRVSSCMLGGFFRRGYRRGSGNFVVAVVTWSLAVGHLHSSNLHHLFCFYSLVLIFSQDTQFLPFFPYYFVCDFSVYADILRLSHLFSFALTVHSTCRR